VAFGWRSRVSAAFEDFVFEKAPQPKGDLFAVSGIHPDNKDIHRGLKRVLEIRALTQR
jgi:hypothetical protein